MPHGRRRSALWSSRRRARAVLLAGVLLALAFGVWGADVHSRLAQGGFVVDHSAAERADAQASRLHRGGADLVFLARVSGGGGSGVPSGAGDSGASGASGASGISGASSTSRTSGPPGVSGTSRASGASAASRAFRVDARPVQAAGARLTQRLRQERGVLDAHSYWTTGRPDFRSRDGRAALIAVDLSGDDSARSQAASRLVHRYTGPGRTLSVRATGPSWVQAQATDYSGKDALRAELIVAPVVIALLLFAFRSALAALLPALTGALAVSATVAGLWLLSFAMPVSVFAINLVSALGFGLSVDYALLLITRYREEVLAGSDGPTAIAETARTAGRTVWYSSLTVSGCLFTLVVLPIPFLRSMAAAGVLVSFLSGLAARVMVPCALSLWGHRLDRMRGADRIRALTYSAFWNRVARAVTRRPLLYGGSCALLLTLLVVPATHVALGLPDERTLPADAGSHAVADDIRAEFLYDAERQLRVVLPRAVPGRDRAAIDTYSRKLSATRGTVEVTSPFGTYRSGSRTAAPLPGGEGAAGQQAGTVLLVTAASPPQSREAGRHLSALQSVPYPGPHAVTGDAVYFDETLSVLGNRLPYCLGLLAVFVLCLVGVYARSVLVPVKALVTSALSLTATCGLLVVVFQWGRLRWLVGDFTPTGTLDVIILLLGFCIALGLCLDYEVFVTARIREEFLASGDNTEAVVNGVSRTGRIVSLAAAAVAVALAALATSHVTLLKQLGVSLASTVVMDATLVRGVLVPAVMCMTARANWWVPRWVPSPVEPSAPHTRPRVGVATDSDG